MRLLSMRAPGALLLWCLLLTTGLVAPQGSVSALTVGFEKIADTGTAIPGGSGNFKSFGRNPSLDASGAAFRGEGDPPFPFDPQQQGIYSSVGGLHAVADQNTAIPNGAGNFETFTFKPSGDGAAVAWSGDGAAAQEGVYEDSGGGAVRIADRTTLLPGGQAGELFERFVFAPVRKGGNTVFHAEGDGGLSGPATKGIYTHASGVLTPVVDTTTAMPGAGANFDFLSNPDLDAGAVAFRGRSAAGFDGVFRAEGGLITVADATTLAPSGLAFQSFAGDPSISDGDVLFRGSDTAGLSGLFVGDGTSITLIADENTLIPEGGGNSFDLFSNYAIDHGLVVFEARGPSGSPAGLYTNYGGLLQKILDLGDPLDGKTLAELEISRESLSGEQMVFWARFSDNSEGVFLATIPEPGTAALLGLALTGLGLQRRRRR